MQELEKEIQEELENEITDEGVSETPFEPPKPSLKAWFGTEDAIRWVYLVLGFFAIALVMILLQFSTDAICCGDWDGYYHIRWSSLIWDNLRHGERLPEFRWLPLTVLNPQDYADHHFLFHLLQIPFLWFFEPVMAAKISTVVFATLAIFSVYWLLYRYQFNYLFVWLGALLTCANPFFYRMNMAKAPPLTIIYSIAGIYLLFERKYIWLMPLMFIFVWTYSLFPILLIAALIWTAIIAWNERKFEWKPVLYTTVGMVLGNIVNPYFPKNLKLFYEHFMEKFNVGGDFAVAVGGEWYAYSGQDLLMIFPIALLAMLVGYILFAPRAGKLPEKATFFLVFATILIASQFRSKRFAEYFPPFAILFAAFSLQAFLQPAVQELPDEFKRDLQPFLDSEKATERENYLKRVRNFISVGVLAVFCILAAYNFAGMQFYGFRQVGLRETIKDNESNTKYQTAMAWITENVPDGERIFNCNWDDFPKMFFYDQKHTYVYGLDPNYFYTANPELYKFVKEVTEGKIEDPGPAIREKLGARFIFSDAKENTDMIANCLESGWCETAYDDDEAIVLEIREEKGEPPSTDVDEGDDGAITDDENTNADNTVDDSANDDEDLDSANDETDDNSDETNVESNN